MKFIHISDLHIGKRLNSYSLIDDQKYILGQILEISADENPDGVIIAGDVYDRSVPSEEAVAVFDDFLVKLSKTADNVFVISGNHDSPERIAFGSRLIRESGVYLSPVFNGCPTPITLKDEYGEADVYLLPFIKPSHVRILFPDAEITDYTSAMECVIKNMNINKKRRNILAAHQFVTNAVQSGSEEVNVGGLDNVDASVFADFDYVALGHIHGGQNIGGNIRYCGTPLKYSFSEVNQAKSVTVAVINEKGAADIRTVPLKPMREMLEIRGTFEQLTDADYIKSIAADSYLHITLTDEDDIPNASARLDMFYPNLMKLDYDNRRTRLINQLSAPVCNDDTSPFVLFEKFFEQRNGHPMNDEQKAYILKNSEEIWGSC